MREREDRREQNKPKMKSCWKNLHKMKNLGLQSCGAAYITKPKVCKYKIAENMKLHKGQNGNLSKRGRLESKIPKTQGLGFRYAGNFASIAKISLC